MIMNPSRFAGALDYGSEAQTTAADEQIAGLGPDTIYASSVGAVSTGKTYNKMAMKGDDATNDARLGAYEVDSGTTHSTLLGESAAFKITLAYTYQAISSFETTATTLFVGLNFDGGGEDIFGDQSGTSRHYVAHTFGVFPDPTGTYGADTSNQPRILIKGEA